MRRRLPLAFAATLLFHFLATLCVAGVQRADEVRDESLRQIKKLVVILMDQENLRQNESNHLIVTTDARQEHVAEVLARNLESVFAAVNRLCHGKIPLRARDTKVRVYLFRNRSRFQAFARQMMPRDHLPTAGFYLSVGVIALQQEWNTRQALRRNMFHEGTHAFLDQYVARPGVSLPHWLHEGLAEYVETSSLGRDGKLQLGTYYRKEQYTGPARSFQHYSAADWKLRRLRKAARRGEVPSLEQLVAADEEQFGGKDGPVYYYQSWAFVHFLRHGRPDWAVNKFPYLVLGLAGGKPVERVFEEVYGSRPADMEDDYRSYINDKSRIVRSRKSWRTQN